MSKAKVKDIDESGENGAGNQSLFVQTPSDLPYFFKRIFLKYHLSVTKILFSDNS